MIADDPTALVPATEVPDRIVHRELQHELGPLMASHDFVGYFVANEKKRRGGTENAAAKCATGSAGSATCRTTWPDPKSD